MNYEEIIGPLLSLVRYDCDAQYYAIRTLVELGHRIWRWDAATRHCLRGCGMVDCGSNWGGWLYVGLLVSQSAFFS